MYWDLESKACYWNLENIEENICQLPRWSTARNFRWETDIDGDDDDNDWMRMLNESFNDFSFTAMLEDTESIDVDEDASYEAAIPDILDNVLSSIWL